MNTIGLADRELFQLLDILDGHETGLTHANRSFARKPFRYSSLILKMKHPGGSNAEIRVACRNLSSGGIGVLHNGFIYPGTSCTIVLPKLDGASEEKPGVICRCQHRRGTLHELGIKFSTHINLRYFVDSGKHEDFMTFEKVQPENLKGRCLFINHCPINQKIIPHFLRESNLSLKYVESASEALNSMNEKFDLVILNWSMPETNFDVLIDKMRSVGFLASIMAIVSDSKMAATIREARLSGVFIIPTPLTQDGLLRAISEQLLTQQSANVHASANSQMSQTLINELQHEMRSSNKKLLDLLTSKSLSLTIPHCLMLKAAASVLGQTAIDSAATVAVASISTNATTDKQYANIMTLTDLVQRYLLTASIAQEKAA